MWYIDYLNKSWRNNKILLLLSSEAPQPSIPSFYYHLPSHLSLNLTKHSEWVALKELDSQNVNYSITMT